MSIRFERFAGTGDVSDTTHFAEFLRIKFAVFGRELEWPIPLAVDGRRAVGDEHDRFGEFVLACSQMGEGVGCLRSLRLDRAFPHRRFLGNLVHRSGLPLHRLATINSVAVLPNHRGRDVAGRPAVSPRTIAARLVVEAHQSLSELGIHACFLTTTDKVADAFFEPLGYAREGDPFAVEWSARPLVNMGTRLAARRLAV